VDLVADGRIAEAAFVDRAIFQLERRAGIVVETLDKRAMQVGAGIGREFVTY
jgi:hypothetical protein